MEETRCRLLGEIRYPDEYSYERVGEIETAVGEVLEEVLAPLAVSRLEVLPGPESLGFEACCPACDPDEAWAVCEALLAMADDGPLGRLIVASGVEEPVTVFYFGGETIDAVTVERP